VQPASLQPAFSSLSRGDVARAVSQAAAILDSGGPDLAEVMKFAEKLRSSRHFQDSIPFFDHVLHHAPDPLEARIGKAKSLCDINDKPAAMIEVDFIKTLTRDSVEGQVKLIDLLSYMKSYRYADEVIKPLIARNPTSFPLRQRDVLLCIQRQKADWTIAALNEAIDATKMTGVEWSFAARTYLLVRKPKLAAQAALQAIERTEPPALTERLLLAQAYVQYDKSKAVSELNSIAPQFEEGTSKLLQAAELYLAAGEKGACRAAVGRILAFYKGREMPVTTKVDAARMLGTVDDQEPCHALLNSIQVDTLKDKQVVKLLHNTAYDFGYFAIAERAARQGLVLTPFEPQFTTRLTQITALGLKDRAVEGRSSSPKRRFSLFRRS
jgi:hypothetical protein